MALKPFGAMVAWKCLAIDRRAGEAEQERIRQRRAHLHAEVAFLGAMRFIDQRDEVVAVVEHGRLSGRGGVVGTSLRRVIVGLGGTCRR